MTAAKTARTKKRARTPLKKPPPKNNQINIRVSDEQKELLAEAATKVGISMSSWMLSVSLREARKVTGRES